MHEVNYIYREPSGLINVKNKVLMCLLKSSSCQSNNVFFNAKNLCVDFINVCFDFE
jgi:hypothetical protein